MQLFRCYSINTASGLLAKNLTDIKLTTMRFLYTILPLLSAVAFATDLEASKCVDKCPKVKCAADDAAVSHHVNHHQVTSPDIYTGPLQMRQ